MNGVFHSGYLINNLKMDILTQIPIGTKLTIKKTGKEVRLLEIRNYPTRYKTVTDSGKVNYYKTHEVEIINSDQEL
mgnify:CR=1 FL=1